MGTKRKILKQKTKHGCPTCKTMYDNKGRAERCHQPPPYGGWKEGDIVQSANTSHVFVIKSIPNDNGLPGATVEPYMPYYISTGRTPPRPKQSFMIGSFWCKAESYMPITKHTAADVRQLKKRLKAADEHHAYAERIESEMSTGLD